MKYALIFLLVGSFLSCSKEPDEALPSCDWIASTFDGETLRYTIDSDSPSVEVCITLPRRISCHTIVAHYYGCNSMEAYPGLYITFEDNGHVCHLTVE